MTTTALLLGLLALAYFGSVLMGGRGGRGYGLPSGMEYVLLGIAVGPHVLSAVDRSTLTAFEPIVATSSAWLALVVGADYGRVGERAASGKALFLGVSVALITAALSGISVFFALRELTELRGASLLIVSAGAAAVSCETTRHVARWAIERYGAHGPLCELLADAADADDAVPLLIMAVSFSIGPSASEAVAPWWINVLGTLTLGVLLGGVAAVLLRVEATAADGWGVLLGAALLATGLAFRLGWSALTVLFVMGISLCVFSRHRHELRAMLARTERPVMLPTLVLAGATVRLDVSPYLPVFVFAAFLPRLFVKGLGGFALGASLNAPPPVRRALGLALLSTGGLTVVIGLAFAQRFPGQVGELVLAVAAAVIVIGEVIGPRALRRALTRAGEIVPERSEPGAAEGVTS